MQKYDIKTIMEQSSIGFLATVDDNKPAVRPIGLWLWIDTEIWIATYVNSSKCKEINQNPNIEFCFHAKEGLQARISGRCKISSSYEDKKEFLNKKPEYQNYIGSAESSEWLVLRISPSRLRISTGPTNGYQEVKMPKRR